MVSCAESDTDAEDLNNSEAALQSIPPADPEVQGGIPQMSQAELTRMRQAPAGIDPTPFRSGQRAVANSEGKARYDAFVDAWRKRQLELADQKAMTEEEWAQERAKFKASFYATLGNASQTGGQ